MSNECAGTCSADLAQISISMKKDKKNKFGNQGTPAEISIKDFLEFLKVAYQVNETIEGTDKEMIDKRPIDWNELANNSLLKNLSEITEINKEDNNVKAVQSSEKEGLTDVQITVGSKKETAGCVTKPVDKKEEVMSSIETIENYIRSTIKTKLNEVLAEGDNAKESTSGPQNQSKVSRRKSYTVTESQSASSKSQLKTEPEVEIHVCDEVKHLKKDFRCSQQLLVSKMGYFAEVTTGQKLEDMDISVHCDIGIFDWLMRWVKKDSILSDDWPKLDATCVIPILVSAAFLQMEPLLQDCLLFCHNHMNEILKTSTNLSCLNDSIVTRLAATYTNSELEFVRDKRDKILSKLYCKLILSLGEPVPQGIRGHWASLAGIFRCLKCEKLVTKDDGPNIPCIPSCMRINQYGDILSNHIRDLSWNLSEHIVQLHRELKTWRRVYWRLWGTCHFLRCIECCILFPAHQMGWCCHHPEQPQFFTMDNQRATPIPVGRYPCCGDRAYRFEVINNPSHGCKFKEHVPDVMNARDLAILTIFNTHRMIIEQEPPRIMIPEKLTRLVASEAGSDSTLFSSKEVFWWEGIELAPPRQKLGLLGKMCFDTAQMKNTKGDLYSKLDATSDSDDSLDDNRDAYSMSSISSNMYSEESPHSPSRRSPVKKTTPKHRRKKKRCYRKTVNGRHWSPSLSARSNQDLQRDFEENAMQQIIGFLSRRTSGLDSVNIAQRTCNAHKQLGSIWNHHITPVGGVYTRLEAEWCEANKHNQPSVQGQNSRLIKNIVSYVSKPKFKAMYRP